MTTAQIGRPTTPALDLSRRDLVVDGARVACVIVVVLAHLLLIGVGVDAAGGFVITKPLTEQAWFPAVSVVGQVMPLFFALGGFAAFVGWASLQRRGGTYGDFLRGRLLRLAPPAVPVFASLTVAIGGARAFGAPGDLVDAVAAGVGTPLWFLAAFVLCQWAAPAMIALHRRTPLRAVCALGGAAVAVDAVRTATGVDPVGLLNSAFVWLFAQQLGFFYADGTLLRAGRRILIACAAGALALLAAGVATRVYAPDMLQNQYPPFFALGLIGVAQLCVLGLAHPALTAVMRTRAARALTFAVGSRLMTIYLWHLPCIVAVIGCCLLVPGWTPAPGSAAWWGSRPAVLLAAAVLLLALSLAVVRFERTSTAIPEGCRRPALWRLHVTAALMFVPPFLIMVRGLDLVLAATALAAYALAVVLLRPARAHPSMHIQ